MSHYFSQTNNTLKSNPKRIAFRACNEDFECITDHGVFAKDGLDRGTAVLLDYLTVEPTVKTALDLGCGYGPIGLVLTKVFHLDVDMVDVNPRAIELATNNLALNHVTATVLSSDEWEHTNRQYDMIVSNPPIRVGKDILYPLLASTYDALLPGGTFWFVINKKHGANSAITFIETIYNDVTVIGRSKGFHVIQCRK